MQKNTKDSTVKKSVDKDLKSNKLKVKDIPINKKTTKSTKKDTSSKAKESVATKTTAKKSSVSVKSTAKKVASKGVTSASATKKATSKKVADTSVAKKVASKKASSTSVAKKSAAKKSSTKTASKASTKKTSKAVKKSTPKRTKKVEVLEYYDLPYRYNQTVVKILAQTPNTLFVYWDISDLDRKKYIDEYGEDFFQSTVPVLIVHNKTMNYSFEIEINDFANSWYFNVNDAKCDYEIELGRRARVSNIVLPNNYMHVASSNVIEAPNNHILFEKNQKMLFFRNIKTNQNFTKDISQFQFMNYIGRIYNIYEVYKKIYKEEELQDIQGLPSSNFFNKGAI